MRRITNKKNLFEIIKMIINSRQVSFTFSFIIFLVLLLALSFVPRDTLLYLNKISLIGLLFLFGLFLSIWIYPRKIFHFSLKKSFIENIISFLKSKEGFYYLIFIGLPGIFLVYSLYFAVSLFLILLGITIGIYFIIANYTALRTISNNNNINRNRFPNILFSHFLYFILSLYISFLLIPTVLAIIPGLFYVSLIASTGFATISFLLLEGLMKEK